MINVNTRVPGAPNFRYREFIRSEVAIRKRINNVPEEWQWNNIERLAVNVLQPVRDYFGRLRINSGFRSEELNVSIGGSKYSNHCRGEASDIELIDSNIKLFHVIDFIYRNLSFRNLILEYPPWGWVHVDYRKGANSRKLKLKDATHSYEEVTLNYLRRTYYV